MEFVLRRVDTAEAFAAQLKEFSPQVVLSDYSMPAFDALAALAITIERAPGTPFIVVTGSLNEETAADCIKAGADDYILKDRTARLPSAIMAALEKRKAAQERLRALQALRESEERFRALIENSSDGVALISPDATIIYASPSTERVLGYPSSELIGQNALHFIHTEDLPAARAMLEGFTPTPEATVSATFRVLRSSGNLAWIAITARNALAEPAVRAIVLNFRDVTETRKAADALQRSEEKLRLIVRSMSDGIFTLDVTGHLDYASPRARSLMRKQEGEILGLRFSQILSGESAERAEEMFGRALGGEQIPLFELEVQPKGGSPMPVELSFSSFSDPQGRQLGWVGVFRDISERRRDEQERRFLVAAIEQAAESIVITDVDGRIQYVNPGFERVTGYSRAEMIGHKPSLLKSGEQDQAFYAALWKTILSGQTWTGHFKNRRKDGTLYEEDASISPVRDNTGTIVNFVAVKRDVTAEVSLEAQLRQSQKMEAVGALAGGIAHDFNNLLQALLTQAQLLGRGTLDPEKLKTARTNMERQIKHGASLTRQLLLFARKGIAKVELLDLNEAIRGAASLLKRLLRENIVFTVDLAAAPMPVMADRSQIEQVLVNLVVNAVDAMPNGGQLTIRSAVEQDPWFLLAVEDSGSGIQPAIRERIFEPFFTTKHEMGTGLGLAVVHGIVTHHGGTIEALDRTAGGTSFHVRLPRSEAQHPAASATEPAPEMPMGHGQRVLVVEDEAGVRDGLRGMLEMLGYKVTTTASGEEVASLDDSPPFDLILTDLVLPGIQGLELARAAEARWPEMQVILMSGYTDDATRRERLQGAGHRFLQKPFGAHDLAAEVHEALARPSKK